MKNTNHPNKQARHQPNEGIKDAFKTFWHGSDEEIRSERAPKLNAEKYIIAARQALKVGDTDKFLRFRDLASYWAVKAGYRPPNYIADVNKFMQEVPVKYQADFS